MKKGILLKFNLKIRISNIGEKNEKDNKFNISNNNGIK